LRQVKRRPRIINRGGAQRRHVSTLSATDLDTKALTAWLTRPELLRVLEGCNPKAANFVLRFGQ
jgi:hypothetical protein